MLIKIFNETPCCGVLYFYLENKDIIELNNSLSICLIPFPSFFFFFLMMGLEALVHFVASLTNSHLPSS